MLFSKIVRIIVRIFMYISMLAVMCLLGMTVVDVLLRLIFKAPITGVIELSQVLLVSIMSTMGAVVLENRNIEVRVIVEAVPRRVALCMDTATLLLSVAYFLIVGWQTLEAIRFSIQFHVVYLLLKLPEWPFLLLLGLSFTVCGFAALVYLINRIARRRDVPAKDKTGLADNPELEILNLEGAE